jgi:hypothetical protein
VCRISLPDPSRPLAKMRAAAAAAAGMQLITPLWGLAPGAVLGALVDLGITARISCVALPKFAAPEPDQPPQQEREQQQQQEGGAGREAAGSGACHCHCVAPRPAPPGPPLFDAVGELLGRPLSGPLVAGPLAAAAAKTGINACGEDGSYHTVVTDCPLMRRRGRRVELDGAPHVDAATGYAYMVWD